MKQNILVVGGCGYIGTHMVKALLEAGHQPITLDNLSKGHRELLPGGDFIQGDIQDSGLLDQVFSAHAIDAVMHFAALIEVGDKNLLIGVTNQSINVLGDIDGETLKIKQTEIKTSAQKGFGARMRDFIIHMKDAPKNLRMARNEAKMDRPAKVSGDDYLARMDDAIQRRRSRITGGDRGDE